MSSRKPAGGGQGSQAPTPLSPPDASKSQTATQSASLTTTPHLSTTITPQQKSFKDSLLRGNQPVHHAVGSDFEELEGDIVSFLTPEGPVVKISDRYRAMLHKRWENTLIVKLWGKKIGYRTLCNRLPNLWNLKESVRVVDLENNFYFVRFQSHLMSACPNRPMAHTSNGDMQSGDPMMQDCSESSTGVQQPPPAASRQPRGERMIAGRKLRPPCTGDGSLNKETGTRKGNSNGNNSGSRFDVLQDYVTVERPTESVKGKEIISEISPEHISPEIMGEPVIAVTLTNPPPSRPVTVVPTLIHAPQSQSVAASTALKHAKPDSGPATSGILGYPLDSTQTPTDPVHVLPRATKPKVVTKSNPNPMQSHAPSTIGKLTHVPARTPKTKPYTRIQPAVKGSHSSPASGPPLSSPAPLKPLPPSPNIHVQPLDISFDKKGLGHSEPLGATRLEVHDLTIEETPPDINKMRGVQSPSPKAHEAQDSTIRGDPTPTALPSL
ncbi:hypothetical protein Tsubulata_026766 [Turnera subulata]|uniref:DUF4283 domain-containing protein n=1 Tax=Turnera subulata TaxID=218843 RepID=A0A9Q0G637_9ROSI|nr:hypothetical protein Tsubulata_026766 [Turnera subulata]